MTSPFSLPLWIEVLSVLWQLHVDVKSHVLWNRVRLFFWNAETGSFYLWSHLFNLYLFREGWLRDDMLCMICFSAMLGFILFTLSPHSCLESYRRRLLCCIIGQLHWRNCRWLYDLLKGTAMKFCLQRLNKFLGHFFFQILLYGPWFETATFWCDTNFSYLQAITAPLRRRIISLRLFGAAPVFSCVVLLIWTWCITRLQTIV